MYVGHLPLLSVVALSMRVTIAITPVGMSAPVAIVSN